MWRHRRLYPSAPRPQHLEFAVGLVKSHYFAYVGRPPLQICNEAGTPHCLDSHLLHQAKTCRLKYRLDSLTILVPKAQHTSSCHRWLACRDGTNDAFQVWSARLINSAIQETYPGVDLHLCKNQKKRHGTHAYLTHTGTMPFCYDRCNMPQAIPSWKAPHVPSRRAVLNMPQIVVMAALLWSLVGSSTLWATSLLWVMKTRHGSSSNKPANLANAGCELYVTHAVQSQR